ncbi:hypothetical protein RFI_05727 [Reticulomyxa filosa]|uniref:Uncharacterized protein n=1 Tax=Reticulomyxa filosa TaxID=46433 RepID=X6NZV9_RETFI|nr:hypothetical protein RFI_05727 [Reticulomyxa filosa]|eukprot:ETO31393.1 hypothetical protein RFI_05727 [Reticulomyxa filosa]
MGIGTGAGHILIYDTAKYRLSHRLSSHGHRVGVVEWRNPHILCSGSRDRNIFVHDIRISPTHQRDIIHELRYHKQEVCGLKWSYDDKFLASGGNDNKLIVWDTRKSNQPYTFGKHKAAVKAISWSPHEHGIITTGGGTADRSIKFWNVNHIDGYNHFDSTNDRAEYNFEGNIPQLQNKPPQMTPIHNIDTGSQVCNLLWSKNVNEIVSTHGYSLNQIVVWSYPCMKKVTFIYFIFFYFLFFLNFYLFLVGHTYWAHYTRLVPFWIA